MFTILTKLVAGNSVEALSEEKDPGVDKTLISAVEDMAKSISKAFSYKKCDCW